MRNHTQKKNTRENPFLCVVAHKFGDQFCNKSFPTIEKHNEHLKRFHSPIFYCQDCLHKFSSSLTDHLLGLARSDHGKYCTKTPSTRSRGLREKAFVMSEAQYNAFKQRQWKKTDVPCMLVNGRKEKISETSWRQIRATIFPASDADGAAEPRQGSSIVGQLDVGIQKVINSSEARPPGVIGRLLTEFEGPPRIGTPRQAAQPPIPTSFTTADDASTDFSTDQQTQPSTLMNSHTGVDGQEDTLSYGIGETVDQDTFARYATDGFQEQSGFDHLTGTGGGAANLESQDLFNLYLNLDALDEQEDLG